eukprot:TRINITY_DN4614_c0_g1_i1.p2 TRINITY_DN4614_c0_g1~~TRINITY_DN4614_c0_g1_i1.p2  ORF type:complete len:238 (-),score=17.97 TRINITY_DN4614_c0_g1_i1:79-792(-)
MLQIQSQHYKQTCFVSISMALKKFVLPPLPYSTLGLEPAISKSVLNVHYNKHHKTYVDDLNMAMEKLHEARQRNDLGAIVALQPLIRFNGGSHICHSMYWENLAPITGAGGKIPSSNTMLYKKIFEDWGSFEKLMNYFTTRTIEIKGVGWSWLVLHRATGRLGYRESHDQDAVTMHHDVVPLLTIDAWEHAFTVDYKTDDHKTARHKYMSNIWKVVNWECVEKRLHDGMKDINKQIQ